MLSPGYKPREFLARVAELPTYDELLAAADGEVQTAKLDRKGERYADFVRMFLCFFRVGKRAADLSDEDFAAFGPICARLVASGEVRPELLERFAEQASHSQQHRQILTQEAD